MSGHAPFGEDVALEISDPRLQRFYAYWLRLRDARRFPARRDIDPMDFSYLLGNIMLVDVLRDPLRFRVRLHGTEMAERARFDLTGKWLDELPATDFRTYILDRCRGLV